jgi:hypothetical protein
MLPASQLTLRKCAYELGRKPPTSGIDIAELNAPIVRHGKAPLRDYRHKTATFCALATEQ